MNWLQDQMLLIKQQPIYVLYKVLKFVKFTFSCSKMLNFVFSIQHFIHQRWQLFQLLPLLEYGLNSKETIFVMPYHSIDFIFRNINPNVLRGNNEVGCNYFLLVVLFLMIGSRFKKYILIQELVWKNYKNNHWRN